MPNIHSEPKSVLSVNGDAICKRDVDVYQTLLTVDVNKEMAQVTDVEDIKHNLYQRLCWDLPFRRRFIHTLCLCYCIVGQGWQLGQMGPSFPDLREIVQKDLDTASWLFTVFSIGYLVGSFIGGILYDRFNKLLLLAFSVLFMAVFTGIIPWCRSFSLMLAMRFISGLGAGGADTGANADLVSLWKVEVKPYMQALHFSFGLGGIMSALVTEPFLSRNQCLFIPANNMTVPDTPNALSTAGVSMAMVVMPSNTSELYNRTTCIETKGETNIHYAYVISFVVIAPAAIPFFVMYFKSLLSNKTPHEIAVSKGQQKRPDKLPLKLKIVLLALLFMLMLTYCAVEDTFAGFLTTFCLKYLKWGTQNGSYLTSLHWIAFSVGRFSGIFLINCFRPVKMLMAYGLFMILSFVGLLIGSLTFTSQVIWLCVPLAGFSMSIIAPTIFTWTEESILRVSGQVSSVLVTAAASGLALNPLFVGYMMDNVAPITFVYILLAETCFMFAIFLTIFLLVKKYVKILSKPNTIEILILPPECELLKPDLK